MNSERQEVLPVEAQADAESHMQAAAGFAPGHGLLTEEVLDVEDFQTPGIHASSIEEIEDLDEETVEGATDLGTMLREMSIDQITRATPEVEDEDELDDEEDFEEDDLDEEELDVEDEEEGDDEEDAERADESEGKHDEAADRTGEAADTEFDVAQIGQDAEANPGEARGVARPDRGRDADRRPGRRDGRRDGRRGRGDRQRGSGPGERFGRYGHSGGRGRPSMQSTNLPAISDLLKPGQEILVQIAKEPIAKKGARITSHIALPGRFLVFMPTVNHTGVSRKIESDGERRRLKEILLSEKGDASGGFIVRTAAEGASEEELRSDLRFLLNLWAEIKARSESSKSPALIYHDLNLIERILRDQVTDNFSAIWVDSESEYERVLRFLQRFQPSLIRRVKLYLKDTPLFEQFGITEEINKALRSKVWLKSGGSIVINQTEALVAIDINTGKYVGKTARLEDTIVKTNLDAIPEIVRQIRLRDLGGIIIIDFIDMDERKNRNRVMAALEEELKSDRAPSKVLQFNDFGLVAITRKRVKQSLERTLSTTCTICEGTGMVKSPVTVCNEIFIEMRKMHKTLDRGDIMLRVHPEVVKQLKASGAKWLLEMEEMAGKTILVKSDPALHPEQFDIH
jgi:ribonuclease G